MADALALTQLLAEAETTFTRETEAILAGQTLDPKLISNKIALIDRLLLLAPAAAQLAAAAPADHRRQLRLGFERMLFAAARNETVLRGALRGSRILIGAAGDVGKIYPAQQLTLSPRSGGDAPTGQVDRLA